ncbi:hypothetical protein SAMN05216326_12512 [Nitrosomonas marina]|uniref:ASCH domain-containing protein n=2 Tax=Nitrosomonas marina TaxID=917 RepID=A0A1I0E4Z4_9PROT|nr:hypothetical protein SAMN05216326_12512 [Nitrosomonas marina]
MVRAILDGRKTQTRRIVKGIGLAPGIGEIYKGSDDAEEWVKECPHGTVGDRLWVREITKEHLIGSVSLTEYVADGHVSNDKWYYPRHTRPSIHMPRLASRITLEITSLRIERLLDITEEDAESEGADFLGTDESNGSYKYGFLLLWDRINGKKSTDSNPWVWVVEFKRLGGNL